MREWFRVCDYRHELNLDRFSHGRCLPAHEMLWKEGAWKLCWGQQRSMQRSHHSRHHLPPNGTNMILWLGLHPCCIIFSLSFLSATLFSSALKPTLGYALQLMMMPGMMVKTPSVATNNIPSIRRATARILPSGASTSRTTSSRDTVLVQISQSRSLTIRRTGAFGSAPVLMS
jgi:hypothetical protein